MRITLQRVSKAICYVDNEIVGKIENGLLIFVGFATNDTFEILLIRHDHSYALLSLKKMAKLSIVSK